MAEGVLREKAQAAGLDLTLDSAGVSGWHEGEPPDSRAIAEAAKNNMDISQQRSRAVEKADFTNFDFIFAMDQSNLETLKQMQPKNATARVQLLLEYATGLDIQEVPDPYYDSNGFAIVLAMIENACDGFLAKL